MPVQVPLACEIQKSTTSHCCRDTESLVANLYALFVHYYHCTTTKTTVVKWSLFQDNLGKPVADLYFTETELMGCQWHQLNYIQIICTFFQTDNHASTSSLSFYRPDALCFPAISTIFIPALMTQPLSSFLKTCPYHLSLFPRCAPL